MRADRLLSILLLLQVHRMMTAGELARRLEVSERTIHRDMEALSAAGVPVYAERGSGGGWALPDGYQTNLTGLNPAEIVSLFVKPLRVLSDLGLDRASEAALSKLLAAMPPVIRRDAEHARQRFYVDMSTWRGGAEAAPCLPTLQDAVWQDRRLSMCYEKGDGSLSERVVDPLGLVAKGNTWYLVAADGGQVKSFRAARVRRAEVLAEAAVRPDGFDLAAHWSQSKSDFVAALPRYEALVRAKGAIIRRMRWSGDRTGRITRVEEPDESGWQRVALRFDTEEEACGYALSFGPDLEVLEPAELRERVRETARQVLIRYDVISGPGRA
ncbi:MAG: helix-turn-helix transcriptional regulator [Bacillota bacterium]